MVFAPDINRHDVSYQLLSNYIFLNIVKHILIISISGRSSGRCSKIPNVCFLINSANLDQTASSEADQGLPRLLF